MNYYMTWEPHIAETAQGSRHLVTWSLFSPHVLRSSKGSQHPVAGWDFEPASSDGKRRPMTSSPFIRIVGEGYVPTPASM